MFLEKVLTRQQDLSYHDKKKKEFYTLNLFRPPKYDTESYFYFTEIEKDWFKRK
jgi:hypothetical protein